MNEQAGNSTGKPRKSEDPGVDEARDNQENEIEAEQESAAAMDADVPQPTADDRSTNGQPE